MPRVSDKTGFACPRPKCGGKMGVKYSKASARGRIIIRIRCCRRCGLRIESRETAPSYDQLACDLEPYDAANPPKTRKPFAPTPIKRKRRILASVG